MAPLFSVYKWGVLVWWKETDRQEIIVPREVSRNHTSQLQVSLSILRVLFRLLASPFVR